MHSRRGLAHLDGRHHPSLGPVVRIVHQARRGVERRRAELSAVEHPITNLREEELEVPRPRGPRLTRDNLLDAAAPHRRWGPMPGRLDGKIALITGVGGAIGRASALLFAAEGATLVGCDREDGSTRRR